MQTVPAATAIQSLLRLYTLDELLAAVLAASPVEKPAAPAPEASPASPEHYPTAPSPGLLRLAPPPSSAPTQIVGRASRIRAAMTKGASVSLRIGEGLTFASDHAAIEAAALVLVRWSGAITPTIVGTVCRTHEVLEADLARHLELVAATCPPVPRSMGRKISPEHVRDGLTVAAAIKAGRWEPKTPLDRVIRRCAEAFAEGQRYRVYLPAIEAVGADCTVAEVQYQIRKLSARLAGVAA